MKKKESKIRKLKIFNLHISDHFQRKPFLVYYFTPHLPSRFPTSWEILHPLKNRFCLYCLEDDGTVPYPRTPSPLSQKNRYRRYIHATFRKPTKFFTTSCLLLHREKIQCFPLSSIPHSQQIIWCIFQITLLLPLHDVTYIYCSSQKKSSFI